MLLTMMKEQSHIGYLQRNYYISEYSSKLHSISELHNSSMLYNSSVLISHSLQIPITYSLWVHRFHLPT